MNLLSPFTFDNHVAHGAIVRLNLGVRELLDHRPYPPAVRQLLGEVMAAMPLFATHLTIRGRVSLQFQGKGATQMLVAQIDQALRVRAMAKCTADASGDFYELLRGGVLALMIEPLDSGHSATQASVPIIGEHLHEALETYFYRSEQLPTLIRLAVRGDELAGFMLQRLPLESSQGRTDDDWEHLRVLAGTLSPDELLEVEPDRLLKRLFADAPPVRRFQDRTIEVACNCNRGGISQLLLALGRDEVDAIVAEQSRVAVTCEFCGREYGFTGVDVVELFAAARSEPATTRH
ncbi:MAG: Hsp33 family molecular chaperone HslO [Panacagrimonas sp.]